LTILSLEQLHTLPGEITTLVLDMAHLWGSLDHYRWARFIKSMNKDRTMTVVAVGWKNVPPIHPGWALNDLFGHEAVELLLDQIPTGAVVYRTHEQLVTMAGKIGRVSSGLVILARGATESMEGKQCRNLASEFGSLTRVIGLNDLPLFLMQHRAKDEADKAREGAPHRPDVKPLLVLLEYIDKKGNLRHVGKDLKLDHWMLLLSHIRDSAILILGQVKPAPDTPISTVVVPPSPLTMIRGWIQDKKVVHPLLTVTIHKPSPWE
jgi:hypothetical protein